MKFFFLLFVFLLFFSCSSKNWRDASRDSVGIAPLPSKLKEDIVLVYYARAFSWRGIFGVHPWIAWKKVEDEQYTVAQVTSWNINREGTAVRVEQDLPDRKWFDSDPTLLFEARGQRASIIIEKAKKLIESYPYKDRYRVWPGPNSNTFVSYLIRNIDELPLELPPHAIGRDYGEDFIYKTASETGFGVSIYGVLGIQMGLSEGVSLNLFGLNFGFDIWTPALYLPAAGRVGFSDKELFSNKKQNSTMSYKIK